MCNRFFKLQDLLFFPINSNENRQTAGGSHWSLLVYFKEARNFVHFDSMKDCNKNEAVKFYKKFEQYFNAKHFQVSLEYPQQTNSSDCGMYVLGKINSILLHQFSQKCLYVI